LVQIVLKKVQTIDVKVRLFPHYLRIIYHTKWIILTYNFK